MHLPWITHQETGITDFPMFTSKQYSEIYFLSTNYSGAAGDEG